MSDIDTLSALPADPVTWEPGAFVTVPETGEVAQIIGERPDQPGTYDLTLRRGHDHRGLLILPHAGWTLAPAARPDWWGSGLAG